MADEQPTAESGDAIPTEIAYPEHAKLARVTELTQAIGEFVDWLRLEKGIRLARLSGASITGLRQLVEIGTPIETLLAECFHIDRDVIEAEKRTMIEQMRAANERAQ